ncbi:ABC transporter permease [Amylibacter kogurei]|uniref:ABC transporter permease n=1 Tax=Paramylibacter kogurei TaxID=1889778 RepID=A0A2G5K858_9RHOB|nr:proline/glycine betaine ABC transporter permease [Amylibacter kogurei]PIB24874.1 ABC transporter permease [Amylibacter kogurei]
MASDSIIDWSKLTWIDPPTMGRQDLRDVKKSIDGSFREFTRANGEWIEAIFDPLQSFLVWFEKVMIATPWPLFLIIVAGLAYYGSRSWKLALATVASFLFIGWLDMWEDTMATVAMVSVSTMLCIAFGIPLGVWMSRSDRVQSIVVPILDVMQTIPSFVYLIPVVMLLGIGKAPALIAVMIYAIPPIVRLTNLGIRLVDKDTLEAADAFGASKRERLWGVQIPLALPNIFAGVNQTIMMALAMVVIAAMIGAGGLGTPVLRAVNNQYLALGMFNGLAIVAIAIIFDRVSQAYGKRLQKHREGGHGV